jgi:hypothetical protein
MFTFHKNDAPPRSRQSLVDFPATGSSSPVSTFDTWTSQSFAGSSHGPTRVPDQRTRALSNKRGSVFTLRSRSDTTTSTTSSIMSLSPPRTATNNLSRPGSPLPLRQSQSQFDLSGPRKSLFRGKKGKRSSDSVGETDQDGVAVGERRYSVMRRSNRRPTLPELPRKCHSFVKIVVDVANPDSSRA